MRAARERAGLSLRVLARQAGTSHATLAAYEAGRVAPRLETFERVVRAAGFTVSATLVPAVAPDAERSRELVEALELAAEFPARHEHDPGYPVFGRRS